MDATEMYGRRACQLVKELANAEPGQITEFNDDFNHVIEECKVHYSQFYELTRYKRAEIIRNLSWKMSHTLPDVIEQNLSEPEKKYIKNHSSTISSYIREMDGLDLCVDMVPSKDPFIKVRVLDDMGVRVLDDREANMACHSIHFLKRTDAECYILQGTMEELIG